MSQSSRSPLLPGATIGMLGSGQLGRMSGMEARKLGYQLHVFSPDSNSPTGQIADREFIGNYDNLDAIREFAKSVDVITLEFENIPVIALEEAAKIVPVAPGPHILEIAQNRLREKESLSKAGLPVTPFCKVTDYKQITSQLNEWNSGGVLKTTAWGYDGKGQVKVQSAEVAENSWNQLNADEAILEKFIEFDAEMSAIGVRNRNGEFTVMGPFRNDHANHILDISVCPSMFPESVENQSRDVVRTIMEKFDIVGLLCVEFFVQGENLMINEIANRPHNSGHLTIEGLACSQFEQHIRAICGLPVGSTEILAPTAMANLLGDIWTNGEPKWIEALKIPDLHLHLYGKTEPKPGRKMGHLTARGTTTDEAIKKVTKARESLNS